VSRLVAVDALRGVVMVIMALDHTRDFIHAGAMSFSPEDLARTTPALFLTRWVTHICAPAFMFLAGVGAFLRLQRDGRKAPLSRFLFTRGLWLVFIELTVMRLAMNFTFDAAYPVLLLVLTALGVSMIVLSALIFLPLRALLPISIAIIVGHNTLDGVSAADLGAFAGVWNLFHQPGLITIAGVSVVVGYPLIPWLAVMALGFCCGPLLEMAPERRQRSLLVMGGALIVGFVLLRGANVYGDPAPWSVQRSPTFTTLSFLRTTKYPPSLQFLLMTLGPALVILAALDRVANRRPSETSAGWRTQALRTFTTIGGVPFFFYVMHFWVLHIVAAVMAWLRYGNASFAFLFSPLPSMGGSPKLFPSDFGYPLWVAYLVWLGIVVALYPLCRRFADFKRQRPHGWTSYF
jgi:uncharacterized membrane protein